MLFAGNDPEMLKRFEQTLRRNRWLGTGDRLLVGVSGGADSMALLDLLMQLSPTFRWELLVAHLDHRLRPDSEDDAEFVAGFCRDRDVPVVVGTADVEALANRERVGLEEAGRLARRRFFETLARQEKSSAIVLGHHADDQAETVLFRMLRGSGLSGLAAMRPKSGRYIRPLLSFRKAELVEYLQRRGLVWRQDATNSCPDHTRNRIRHDLLPHLETFNPKVVEALNRLSVQAANEEAFWEAYCADLMALHGKQGVDGYELRLGPLRDLTPAERRRLLRAFLERGRDSLAGIEAEHVEQVEALLESGRPQVDVDLPGLWVGRRYDRLLCAPVRPQPPDYEVTIPGPGEFLLPTGDRLQVVPGEVDVDSDFSAAFAADRIRFPLVVRPPRAGDRFQPSGMSGTKLLKDYFIDEKIDRENRKRTPVVRHAGEVIWLAGRRRCEGYEPVPGEKVLTIVFIRSDKELE